MKLNRLTLLAAVAGLSLSAHSLAADYPAPIESMRGKGVEILDTFDAPSGLSGYAALYQGRPLTLYLTSDQQHVLIGSLLDAEGDDLSGPVIEEKISGPQSSLLWKQLDEEGNWIAEGDASAERIVYVFTDPNCPYCKRFWNDAQPWVKSGKVQLRHIPVGVLGDASRKKAAAMLAADNPLKMLVDNESGKKSAPEASLNEALEQKLENNLALMSRVGATGTPSILYLDDKDLMQLYPGAAQGEQLLEIFGSKP